MALGDTVSESDRRQRGGVLSLDEGEVVTVVYREQFQDEYDYRAYRILF